MNIYIYSDESGVFDPEHNSYFVFAGIMTFSSQENDAAKRKYCNVEKTIRTIEEMHQAEEVKASAITNPSKSKLYRSLNGLHKFGVVVNQDLVLKSVSNSKKTKQRYLDYVYKISVKRKFEKLIADKLIDPQTVENLYFFVDEHTTATDGRYELQEALEHEFKYGTHNSDYNKFFPPIFPHLKGVTVSFCNSKNQTLVRAADIVANKLYYHANQQSLEKIYNQNNYNLVTLP